MELDKRDDCAEIQSILGKMTGAKTVPRVFVNGDCIGGGNDVKRLHAGGNLLPLLQKWELLSYQKIGFYFIDVIQSR